MVHLWLIGNLLQAIDDHKARFDREMLLQGKYLPEQEVQHLLAAHKAEVKAMERNYNEERVRQQKQLKQKVCASVQRHSDADLLCDKLDYNCR